VVNPPRVLVVEDNAAMLARATTVLGTDCVVVGAVTDGPALQVVPMAALPETLPFYESNVVTPEQWAARIRLEIEKWSKVVRDANLRIE